MRWLSDLSISRNVTTIMIIVAMVGIGIASLFSGEIPLESMPEFNLPVVTVQVVYPGVSPEDMASLVADPIESAVESISGIDQLESFNNESSTFVLIWFEWGADLSQKVTEIRDEVSKIRNGLPSGIEEPVVSQFDVMGQDVVMNLNVSGENLLEVRNIAEEKLRPILERTPGVASVEIYGGLKRRVLVKVDPHKLENYGLNINDVIDLLRSADVNMPAGTIREGAKEFLLRVMGNIDRVEDIEELVLYNKDGQLLQLSDIADIYLGTEERDSYNRVANRSDVEAGFFETTKINFLRFIGQQRDYLPDGELNSLPSVNLEIIKESGGNAVDIADRINTSMSELNDELESGMDISIGYDSSEMIKDSLSMVANNAMLGLIFASLVLFIFLKNVRATIIVATAIPVSIIFTFVLIRYRGLSLNMMSLGGLALGVGMLVDNAVVVLENIYRHMKEYNKPVIESARDGAAEMGLPILASTATTMAVFLPLGLTQGISGEIFRDFSFTVAFSLGASLIVALTFVPMSSSKILKRNKELANDGKLFIKVKDYYHKIIIAALGHRGKVVGIAFLTLVFVVYLAGFSPLKVGMDFFPPTDNAAYSVNASLPTGLDVERANEIAQGLEKIVKENEYTTQIITTVRKESVSLRVDIPDKEFRKVSTDDVVNNIREKTKNIPDATINVAAADMGPGGGGGAIQIEIFGDNYRVLEGISREIENSLGEIKGIVDISNSFEGGNPEIKIKVKRDKAAYYDMSVGYISSMVNSKLMGITPLTLKTSGEEIEVAVELKDEFKDSVSEINNLSIPLPGGGSVRLKEVAMIEVGEGPSSVVRKNKQQVISVSADTSGRDLGSIRGEINEKLSEINLPRGYSVKLGGDLEEMQEAIMDMAIALLIAIFLVYMILASQFESFILPGIVMMAVPLAAIGVGLGLVITRYNISVTVMVGLIVLAGIVVNNAIVLIDYINLLKARDLERHEAIRIAGETRLRPILMTTTTTIFGMIPLSLGIGAGSDFYQPLAITVISGLLISTLLTLVLIPVMYSLMDDLHQWYMNKTHKQEA